jgi:tetratricopeptide (TPR) repeat protein
MAHAEISSNPPTDPAFDRTLMAALGYFDLKMWNDSWNELEELAPEFRFLPGVVLLLVMIYNNLGKWIEAAIVGWGAIQHYPSFGALYIATAHALRHCCGPGEAKALITAGRLHLRDEAIFHYALACYDSALGNMGEAKKGLQRAFELDPKCRINALDEADMEPLWYSL